MSIRDTAYRVRKYSGIQILPWALSILLVATIIALNILLISHSSVSYAYKKLVFEKWKGTKQHPDQISNAVSSNLHAANSTIWLGRNLDKLKDIRAPGRPGSMLGHFGTVLSVSERQTMSELINLLKDVAETYGLTYFPFHGTLLGSYRHHGLIPWDDDFDVVMDYAQRSEISKAFSAEISYPYRYNDEGIRWKIWSNQTNSIREGFEWSFPFIDIFFFERRDGFLYDKDDAFHFQLDQDDVFPLVTRPFWDMWLPVPRNYMSIIEKAFDTDDCVSTEYSHRREWRVPSVTVNCTDLFEHHPFTVRSAINDEWLKECLVLNDDILYCVKVKQS